MPGQLLYAAQRTAHFKCSLPIGCPLGYTERIGAKNTRVRMYYR